MITCTAELFEAEPRICCAPATQRVTITGADRAKGTRGGSQPTPWNADKAPRCDACARMDQRIVARMYPGATFDAEPVTAGV